MRSGAELAGRVADTALRIHRRTRQEEAVHGLTGARLAALARLASEGRLSLGGLAAAEGVAPATMARIVDGLEDGKLVVRQQSSEDRRTVWVIPTTLGRSLVKGAHRRGYLWLESYLTRLSQREQATVERAIAILARATEIR
jgi:DNA-binding MarR family transcriptional regulator